MSYRFGPQIDSLGVTFYIWAPGQRHMHLVVKGSAPAAMERVDDGFFALRVSGAAAGTLYKFACAGNEFPDPASRRQARDSSGWSVVVASFDKPRRPDAINPWSEAIIAEVHVGTATLEGTFKALTTRLPHFADAGYTALELMPLAEFPGNRNWGYDGVLPFAPEHSYGPPADLRALVDRAHELGLCVLVDVVYNHFGEKHNFLPLYAPEFFNDSVETPWGPGIDVDNSIVRTFFCENVRMWIDDYDLDGLRFDAVHEIGTESADAFLQQIARTARKLKPNAWLILENMDNCASWLGRDESNRPVDFTAQWNDQVHHALNDLVTSESRESYKDGQRNSAADIAKALAEGFVETDDPVPRHDMQPGIAAEVLNPAALVSFVQNHDQIGNRADSKRLPSRVDAERLDFLHFSLMLSPQTPMFFMGEEGHLRTKFPFFTDLGGKEAKQQLAERERQLIEIFDDPAAPGQVPDPSDPATFALARLNWPDFEKPMHKRALVRFRELAGWRRQLLWPITSSRFLKATSTHHNDAIRVTWTYEAGTLTLVLNPCTEASSIAAPADDPAATTGEITRHGKTLSLGPWSAAIWSHPAKAKEPQEASTHSVLEQGTV